MVLRDQFLFSAVNKMFYQSSTVEMYATHLTPIESTHTIFKLFFSAFIFIIFNFFALDASLFDAEQH